MFSKYAFFSFIDLVEGGSHRAYNEWHQLDHQPENLLLPGVAHDDRWARTADCAAGNRKPAAELAGTDYVTMYWFRPPHAESVREWTNGVDQRGQTKLGEDSFQRGAHSRPARGGGRGRSLDFQPVQSSATPHIGLQRTRRVRAGELRIRLLYLDGDPVEATQTAAEQEQAWDAEGRGAPAPEAETVLLSSPLRTIIPWQDW